MRHLNQLGVCAVKLGAPLYFDLKGVKLATPDINIRLTVNICNDGFFNEKDGICGTYIRPEDVDLYAEYVDTLLFEAETLTQEFSLLETYKKKFWGGNLNLLLTNLNCNVDNRAIPEEFGAARIQCRHNCMRNKQCSFCETAIKFSNKLTKERNK